MDRIFKFLRESEKNGKIIQGLKTFSNESRTEFLIERLKEFNEEITLNDISSEHDAFNNQPNPEWYLYRKLALMAINQFITDFPFLMHTPSSLRSVFGMPTRKDRKRGRYSGKELINTALDDIKDLNDHINFESVYELMDCLKEVINDYPKYETECNNLLTYLNKNLERNSLSETNIPEISTHSIDSLEKSKSFLEKHQFTNVIHEGEPEYPYKDSDDNKILTPDFICEIWDNPVWFELKEWANFNIFLSPIKQLLSYLNANIETKKSNEKSYIGILVENEVDFFKFLLNFNQEVSFKELRESIQPSLNKTSENSENIHKMRKDFFKIGKILIDNYNLQIKAESLYIGLILEFFNKELGMVNTEMEAGKTIVELINKLESHEDKLLILPINKLKDIIDQPIQNFIIFLGVLD